MKEIIDQLKLLVEGKKEPEEWVEWWAKNEAIAKEFFNEGSFSRICTRSHKSAIYITERAQRGAIRYLAENKILCEASDRYSKAIWLIEEPLRIEEERKEKETLSMVKVFKSYSRKLYSSLIDNSDCINLIEPGASKNEISELEADLGVKLPEELVEFLLLSKHFSIEGFEISLSSMFIHPYKTDSGHPFICIGNYFLEADGDQILMDLHNSKSEIIYYSHENLKKLIRRHSPNLKSFFKKMAKEYIDEGG